MMRLFKILLLTGCCLTAAASAIAAVPAIGFDIEHARGHNYYFFNFYVNQVLGNAFTVVGNQNLSVTHLGAFDMNPDNEPYWDVPVYAEHGFVFNHGVALFDRADMSLIAQVMLPAGTSAPIRDEGYRYLALAEPVTLEVGGSYVLAAWWSQDTIDEPDMDTFYLLGTSPTEIPSAVYIHDSIQITDSCFNPDGGDGSSVPAPFIFDMYWGLYAGGANFLIEQPIAVENGTWSDIKNMFR
ncbi:MAG: hypothetical protein RBT60_08660 [Candidatus Krumholzibacteria bacterium]|jgi:hypothetical protein|nr:hypothetical protein [Candidatus Krumholzibacteria bacterium]